MEEDKAKNLLTKIEVQGQKQILAKHLYGHERSDFCDFDKLRKHAYQKGKVEPNQQSKQAGRSKQFCGKEREVRQSRKLWRN